MVIFYSAIALISLYAIRVSVYLLWLYLETEKTIKGARAFEHQSSKNAQNVLFIGDSLTFGVGASDPSKSIAGLFYAENPNFNVYNKSVNRSTTRDLLKQIEKSENPMPLANVCVLSIGGNDIVKFRSMRGIEGRVKHIVKVLDSTSEAVYIFTPTKPGRSPLIIKLIMFSRLKKLRNLIQSLEIKNVHHVDMWESGDELLANPKKYFAKDTLHLSDAGQLAWYERLKKSMER